jgi:hypothetical protein
VRLWTTSFIGKGMTQLWLKQEAHTGPFSWIVQVGRGCNHKCPFKREISHRRDVTGWPWLREIWRCYDTGFRDGWRGHKPRKAKTRSWKNKEKDSPVEPLGGARPCWHLDVAWWNWLETSGLLSCKIVSVSCKDQVCALGHFGHRTQIHLMKCLHCKL